MGRLTDGAGNNYIEGVIQYHNSKHCMHFFSHLWMLAMRPQIWYFIWNKPRHQEINRGPWGEVFI